jgi:hypothetical protein
MALLLIKAGLLIVYQPWFTLFIAHFLETSVNLRLIRPDYG